jgi:polar amino acid transport system permease protein
MTLRDFGWNEVYFLLLAARWTLVLSLIAFAGGGVLGLVVAALRVAPSALARRAAIIWIRAFQGTPLLVQLLIIYYGSSFIGLRPDAWTAAALTLSLNSSAFFGEIWRGCIESIGVGQWDGARALGFRFLPTLRLVVLPQALRLMLAPTIGYMVQIVKSTSVVSLIGINELTRSAVLINSVTFEPLRVFSLVAATYFLLCWPLSLLAEQMGRRMDSKRSSGIGDIFRNRATPRPAT